MKFSSFWLQPDWCHAALPCPFFVIILLCLLLTVIIPFPSCPASICGKLIIDGLWFTCVCFVVWISSIACFLLILETAEATQSICIFPDHCWSATQLHCWVESWTQSLTLWWVSSNCNSLLAGLSSLVFACFASIFEKVQLEVGVFKLKADSRTTKCKEMMKSSWPCSLWWLDALNRLLFIKLPFI